MNITKTIAQVEIRAKQVSYAVVDGHRLAQDSVVTDALQVKRTADYNAAREAILAQLRA